MENLREGGKFMDDNSFVPTLNYDGEIKNPVWTTAAEINFTFVNSD